MDIAPNGAYAATFLFRPASVLPPPPPRSGCLGTNTISACGGRGHAPVSYCMATTPGVSDLLPPSKHVQFIYSKLNGVDGAEVSTCAGGAANIRFVSNGFELDTTDFHGPYKLDGFAPIKALRAEYVTCGGKAMTLVSCTLHPPGRESFGLSAFAALPLDGPVARAVELMETEVEASCATAHVKSRVIRALHAYAGTSLLLPAFQMTQIVSPGGDTNKTVVLISDVRTCTVEFVTHLVSNPIFGVTRAIFRAAKNQLELEFTGDGGNTTLDTRVDIERPHKRRKYGFNMRWPFS